MDNYKITVLPGGVRIISEFIPHFKSFSLGFWINVGSRDENSRNNGITHFIEHMIFKGTKKRTAKQISDSIEAYGGYLNAFTSKEETCVYVRGLENNFDIYFDVLSDLVQNPLFRDSHIKKEAGVVIDELRDIEDNPEELIFDKFEEKIFSGNSLSYPIIGTEKNILSFDSTLLHQFHKKFYRADNLLIVSSGCIGHEKIVELAQRHIHLKSGNSNQKRKTFIKNFADDFYVEKETNQIHTIIGKTSFGFNDERRTILKVLTTLLGEGSSSRLFQAVREKLGITYQINSFLNSYKDVSAFGVYYSTSEKHWEKVYNIIIKEFNKITEGKIKDSEIKRVKEYLKGNTILSLENTTNRMIRLANSILHYGKILSIEETIRKIDNITKESLIEIAQEVLSSKELMTITLGSKNKSINKAA
ncbi:MAG: insulinase family protein [Ignavibacterium album]|uniref:M16 family metallopeptidase n=1 Tax=Ignavibacterium album TaxID=591197 RepID=UPI0026F30DE0|nr:pitrilysin family protein [Ignavibacterium album]MBI5661564.1 insulinase family protein [Ignavibacterium album]